MSDEAVKDEIARRVERIFEAAIEKKAGDCDTSSVSSADSFPSRGSLDGTAEAGAKSATESVVEQKTVTRLKQTGAEYKGLLGYYIDNRAVTFWADGVEIDAEQLDELLEEIREIIRIHKGFAGKG